MLTIGIELNHVVRDINKQIAKYYIKNFSLDTDIEDVDLDCDIFKTFAKFDSSYERGTFLYIDYPFEIFGSAPPVDKKLPIKITSWLSEITNIEDEDIRIIFYSLNEEALTIQSTFFFLSKIGARVRKVVFPKSIEEVWGECDAVITARDEFFEKGIPDGKKVILINKPFNEGFKETAFLNYDSLTDIINDKEFFNKVRQ